MLNSLSLVCAFVARCCNSPAEKQENYCISVANTIQSRNLLHQRSQVINTPTTPSKKCQAQRKAFFGYFLWLWKESYPAVGRDRRFKLYNGTESQNSEQQRATDSKSVALPKLYPTYSSPSNKPI
jgi:hypothetical protein